MKKLLSLSLAALFALSVCAKPVDHSTAIRVAQNFAKSQVKMADYSATIVYTHTMPKSGQPAMYAINVGNSAFVIVAADDVAHPVLGYSMSRPWPTVGAYPSVRLQDERQTGVQLPSQVSGFLDDLAAQIETGAQASSLQNGAQPSTNPDLNIVAEWQQLLSSEFNIQNSQLNLPDSVGPLLTTTWDQGQYYNALCPEDANGPAGRVWTGCVATAMAQIINYWGYPIHGRGTHSYQSDYGTLTVNYDSATYDYANMPNALTSTSTPQEINAVAKLMYDCGVAAGMSYGPIGSGANEEAILTTLIYHYGYDIHIQCIEKYKYLEEEWGNKLKDNIREGKPIVYCGSDVDTRHAFICDGYKLNEYYHFNYGWSGFCDGWYLLSAITPGVYSFSSQQKSFVDIQPDTVNMSVVYWTDVVTVQPEGYIIDSTGVVQITSAEGLAWWAKKAIEDYITDMPVSINVDIDLSMYLWKPITYYSGGVDGGGYCISNMISINTDGAAGFFETFQGPYLKNVGFKNSIVIGNVAGSLAGEILSYSLPQSESMSVTNCYSINCFLCGYARAGGLIGNSSERTEISNCFVIGTVYSIKGAGGIVGGSQSDITNCYTSIKAICASDNLQSWRGMITGYKSTGNIENCYVDTDYVSINSFIFWQNNPIYYIIGSPNNYGTCSNLLPFTKETNDARIITGLFDIEGNIDTCNNLVDALNINVHRKNTPSYKTWIWNDTIGLPVFDTFFIPSCPNIESLTAKNVKYDDSTFLYLLWREIGNASAWQIKCVPLNNTEESIKYYTSNDTFYIINDLIFGNSYDIYVKPLCQDDPYIGWGEANRVQYDLPYWTDVVTSIPVGYSEDALGNVTISSAEGLAWFSVCVNGLNGQEQNSYDGKSIRLTTDIDLSGYRWKPIGHHYYYPVNLFTGSFNGDNHIITNRYCNEAIVESMPHKTTCVGFFGSVINAEIKNVIITNSIVKGSQWVGGLSGYSDKSIIDNCHITANVVGSEKVGGLVGEVCERSTIVNCSTKGSVVGNFTEIGGTVGVLISASSLKNSFSSCSVHNSNLFYFGGFVGHVAGQSNVENCYYIGDVTAIHSSPYYTYAGAVLGPTRVSSHISNVYWGNNVKLWYLSDYFPPILFPQIFTITSEDLENDPTTVVDTSSFVLLSDSVRLIDTIVIGNIQYNDLLSALNAWVDANNSNGQYLHWAADTANVNDGFPVFAAIPCMPTSASDSIFACESYTWRGNVYTASTELLDTLVNFDGCDSIVTHYLIVNHSTMGDTSAIACESFTWQGTTYSVSGDVHGDTPLQNAAGCDSTVTLHLTINNPVHTAINEAACEVYTWNGIAYTASGNYTNSHADNNGCMQADTLHLTINNPVHTATTETACETYTWNGAAYTTSGNYTFSHADDNGCTQVDTLHLTINNPVHTATTETVCETYTWNGTAYAISGNYTYSHADNNGCTQVDTLHLTINNPVHTATTETACETYTWNGTSYNSSGNYIYNHADNNGCMQVDTLHLTINNPVHTVITETACEIYTWNGTAYTTSGYYTYSHADNNGCTQVDTLHLTINNPIHTAITEVACETYTWNDSIYTTSGDYINSHVDANSCTQVDTLHLTINLDNAGVETITACNSFLWHGVEYTQSTNEPTYTSLNVNGCDSVTTLNLTINHCSTTEITACDSYLWMAGNGQTYTESGEYYHGTDTLQLTIRHSTEATIIQTSCDSLLWNGVVYYSTPLEDPMMTIVNSVGCDSVITLHLTINHSTLGDTMVVACESFTWWNTNYTNSTNDATHVLTNAVGCDSTVTLHLTINNPLHTATSETACEIYTWHGTAYTTSGNYTFSHADNNGCTQVDTLHLTINNPVHTVTSETACEIYTWNSTAYTISGNYTYSHADNNGCTQVDTLHLTINNPIHTTIMEMACETYTWNGAVYTNSGDYTYSHADNNGCTQVDTLHLTIKNPVHTAATETVCDAYTWNSTVYMMSGDYTYTHLDNNGCAQVDTLHLTINNPVHTAITETACEAFVWNGTTYTSGGSYTYSHTDNNGCTQVDTLYLIINSPVAIEIYDTVCESYSWNNTDFTASGGYVQTRMSAVPGGCDTTVTLHLTINNPIHTATTEAACETYAWNGTVYTTSGNYTYNHADINGCMQVDTLYLVINHNNVGIETVEACNAFLWHGVEYTVSTSEPTFTSTNINGCDSVTILNLTINHCSTTLITACDSYVWITGSGLAYNESGVYYHETDTLRLTILNSTEGVDVQNACDSFTWWNTNYTNSTNDATHVLTNAAGCDSTVTLHLTINHSTVGDTSAIACESFTWQGTTYSVSGDVHGGTPLQNAAGCDSVVMLHLTINNPIHTAIVEVACETYTWNGTSYTASGNYTYNHTDNNGCTQVDTLHLTINNPVHTTTTETACETYTWNGTSYTSSGNYTYSHADNNGCVQADTLHLTINNPVHTATTETACEIYTWNGTTYTTSGNYTYSHADNNGCVQVDTLHLTINTPVHTAINETACETYTWNGTVYTTSGNYTYSHADNNGCTQVDTLHLTINNPVHTATSETACETYSWNGTAYTTSGNYTYSHADANACTQVDTLHLTINNPVHMAITEMACETYSWNGTTYTTSGNYTYSHADNNGCTQVDTLHLTIDSPVAIEIYDTVCDSYNWNGTDYTVSGEYVRTLPSTVLGGCDTTEMLHLIVNYSVVVYDSITIASTELPYDYLGNTIEAEGDYTFTGVTTEGCDSTMNLNVTVNQVGIGNVVDGTDVRVYPNPTDGVVTVEGRGVECVEVMDISGRVLIDQKCKGSTDCRIDISMFRQGAYLLRVTTVEGVSIRKVVKQ